MLGYDDKRERSVDTTWNSCERLELQCFENNRGDISVRFNSNAKNKIAEHTSRKSRRLHVQ